MRIYLSVAENLRAGADRRQREEEFGGFVGFVNRRLSRGQGRREEGGNVII